MSDYVGTLKSLEHFKSIKHEFSNFGLKSTLLFNYYIDVDCHCCKHFTILEDISADYSKFYLSCYAYRKLLKAKDMLQIMFFNEPPQSIIL